MVNLAAKCRANKAPPASSKSAASATPVASTTQELHVRAAQKYPTRHIPRPRWTFLNPTPQFRAQLVSPGMSAEEIDDVKRLLARRKLTTGAKKFEQRFPRTSHMYWCEVLNPPEYAPRADESALMSCVPALVGTTPEGKTFYLEDPNIYPYVSLSDEILQDVE